ncbi:unnamed protein product [Taenia asiatica]|uniref:Uncharacterized protein n=1 Tax=Taenia asiatica TaxID=60517 RepID=A0A0R3WEM1_TAEAS|nr:unnamed protein product [Taenia asiatica]
MLSVAPPSMYIDPQFGPAPLKLPYPLSFAVYPFTGFASYDNNVSAQNAIRAPNGYAVRRKRHGGRGARANSPVGGFLASASGLKRSN